MEGWLKKQAQRLVLQRWPLPLALSVMAAGVVCWQAHQWLRDPAPSPQTPRFLVARHQVPSGQPISAIDFQLRHLRPDEIPLGAMTDQDLGRLQGAVVREALKPGAVLTESGVEFRSGVMPLAKLIPRGKRAYTLYENQLLELQRGDQVDVFFSPSRGGEPATVVVEGATVLKATGSGEVILAVSPLEISLLEQARRQGQLTVVARSMEEENPERRRLSQKGQRRKVAVPVFSEGGE